MPGVEWNTDGTRVFETGIDRGMLYVGSLPGVPWNGLLKVSESPTGGMAQEFFIDGEKFAATSGLEEYSATIQALSFPSEFAVCAGRVRLSKGLYAGSQSCQPFGFTYRTLIGDDINGIDAGYKIHIVYNAVARISDFTHQTLSDNTSATPYSFVIISVPEPVSGPHKPSSHIVLDSRRIEPVLLSFIEDNLYGSDSITPRLPSPDELLSILAGGVNTGHIRMKKMRISGTGTGKGIITGVVTMKKMTLSGSVTATHIGRVGVFNGAAMKLADFNAQNALWQTWTGHPIKVTRVYLTTNPQYSTSMQQMVAAGTKMCISLHPPYNPVSATERTNIGNFCQTLRNAGAIFNIAIWTEPYLEGLTAQQYKDAVAYYGPTIRQYCPLVFCTSGTGVNHNNENNFYPGDDQVDECATDAYINANSYHTLDLAAYPANNAVPPKPFSVWEFNGSTDEYNGSSEANITLFFQDIVQEFMAARKASGLPPGDIILFNGDGQNSGYRNWLGCGATPNAGFEGGQANWVTAGNCTKALTSTYKKSGSQSVIMSCNVTGPAVMQIADALATSIDTQGLPCVAGDKIWGFAHFYPVSITRNVRVSIGFYDAAKAALPTTTGTAMLEQSGLWTRPVVLATAPTGAAYCRILPGVEGSYNGDQHAVDDVSYGVVPASANLSQIEFAWDYRLPLWTAIYDELNQG
jgi:hypothetical protein